MRHVSALFCALLILFSTPVVSSAQSTPAVERSGLQVIKSQGQWAKAYIDAQAAIDAQNWAEAERQLSSIIETGGTVISLQSELKYVQRVIRIAPERSRYLVARLAQKPSYLVLSGFVIKYAKLPIDDYSLLELGDQLWRNGKAQDVEKVFAVYMQRHPTAKEQQEEFAFKVADSYFWAWDYQQSAERYQQFIERYPQSAYFDRAALRQALSYRNSFMTDSSVVALELLLAKRPDSRYAGAAKRYQRELSLCRPQRELLLAGDQAGDQAYLDIAYINKYLGNTDDAVLSTVRMGRRFSESSLLPAAFLLRAEIYLQAGKVGDAVSNLAKIKRYFPQHSLVAQGELLAAYQLTDLAKKSAALAQVVADYQGTPVANMAEVQLAVLKGSTLGAESTDAAIKAVIMENPHLEKDVMAIVADLQSPSPDLRAVQQRLRRYPFVPGEGMKVAVRSYIAVLDLMMGRLFNQQAWGALVSFYLATINHYTPVQYRGSYPEQSSNLHYLAAHAYLQLQDLAAASKALAAALNCAPNLQAHRLQAHILLSQQRYQQAYDEFYRLYFYYPEQDPRLFYWLFYAADKLGNSRNALIYARRFASESSGTTLLYNPLANRFQAPDRSLQATILAWESSTKALAAPAAAGVAKP